MKKIRLLIAVLLPLFFLPAAFGAEPSGPQAAEEEIDLPGVIFGHIGDAYEWHITDWGDKTVAIPLPVILYDRATGWHVFSSHHLEHGEYRR